MDKKTFINELKQALSVLQEEELNDIISEYEQHIDMKQKDGLTEEEAIADFGSLKELAADILAAYHVRADYAKEPRGRKKKAVFPDGSKTGPFRQQAGEIGAKAKTGILGGIHGLRIFLYRLWLLVRNLAGKPLIYIKDWQQRRRDGQRMPDEEFLDLPLMETEEPGIKAGGKESSQEKRPSTAVSRRRRTAGGFLGTIIRAFAKSFRFAWRTVLWGLRVAWNACCLMFALFSGFCGLFSLYALGMLAVLLAQGYPLAGVTLGCLGLVLCFFSAAGLGITLLKRKRGQHA